MIDSKYKLHECVQCDKIFANNLDLKRIHHADY